MPRHPRCRPRTSTPTLPAHAQSAVARLEPTKGNATAEQAIQLLEATGISQLPVISADGKPVGSVQEVTLARLLHDRRDPSTVKIGDVMARPLPTLDVHTHIDEAYRLLLAGYTGVLATEKDAVVDIITRIDLIHYWDSGREK